jgi:hypothetical protein
LEKEYNHGGVDLKKMLMLAMIVLFGLSGTVLAEEKGSGMHEGQLQTIRGEVIDVSCYVSHGAIGEAHKECAVACLKAGQPGGILEEGTSKVYIAAKEEDHLTNPNTELIPYAAKMVEVKGVVHERGGVATIDIKEIKEIGSPATKEGKGSGMMEEKKGSGMMEEKKGSGH